MSGRPSRWTIRGPRSGSSAMSGTLRGSSGAFGSTSRRPAWSRRSWEGEMFYARISAERIGVLIGPEGTTKERLQKATGTRISVDSTTGDVTIDEAQAQDPGEDAPADRGAHRRRSQRVGPYGRPDRRDVRDGHRPRGRVHAAPRERAQDGVPVPRAKAGGHQSVPDGVLNRSAVHRIGCNRSGSEDCYISSGLPRWGSGLAKHVYAFEEGAASMRDLLGGKGAGLAEMTRLGLPVPPGFTITTKACNTFTRTGRFPPGMWKQVEEALSAVEAKGGRKFGDPEHPLLVSVRSGAKLSMPGMMDTVLNLGLNDTTVEALGRTANERFAWDAYRRLVAMFGRIVKDVDG